MAKTLEELAKEIYNEALEDGEPVSEDEALEMAKMELGAKEIPNYTQAAIEKKAKKPRERKVDETKKFILEAVIEAIYNTCDGTATMENETDIHFTYKGDKYSLKLTKHRPPKK